MREDCFDQVGGGVENVLAVVEHQQPQPALQRGGHGFAHGFAWLLGDAQHRRDRVGYRRRIGDCGEFEKPDAVGKFIDETRRDLQRQAGLADPTHPGQRHQPMSLDRRLHLVEFGLASDEARRRSPQVPRTRIQRPQRRELRTQARCSDLKQPDRGRQIPQPPRPQIHQINATDQNCRRIGQQNLPAMPGGHHPRSTVQRDTEVVSAS